MGDINPQVKTIQKLVSRPDPHFTKVGIKFLLYSTEGLGAGLSLRWLEVFGNIFVYGGFVMNLSHSNFFGLLVHFKHFKQQEKELKIGQSFSSEIGHHLIALHSNEYEASQLMERFLNSHALNASDDLLGKKADVNGFLAETPLFHVC